MVTRDQLLAQPPKAEATTVDGQFRVFVELRDVNYPGSTYDLRYDAGNDQLVGEYFLAAQQQRIQVYFERRKITIGEKFFTVSRSN